MITEWITPEKDIAVVYSQNTSILIIDKIVRKIYVGNNFYEDAVNDGVCFANKRKLNNDVWFKP